MDSLDIMDKFYEKKYQDGVLGICSRVRKMGILLLFCKSCEAFQEEQTVEVKKWLGALYLIHFGRVI